MSTTMSAPSTTKYLLVRKSTTSKECGAPDVKSTHDSITDVCKAMETIAGDRMIKDRGEKLPFKSGEIVYCALTTPGTSPSWGEFSCVPGWTGMYAAEEPVAIWEVIQLPALPLPAPIKPLVTAPAAPTTEPATTPFKPLVPLSALSGSGEVKYSNPLAYALLGAMSSVPTSSILWHELCQPLALALIPISNAPASSASTDLSGFRNEVKTMLTNLHNVIQSYESKAVALPAPVPSATLVDSSSMMKVLTAMQSKIDQLVENKRSTSATSTTSVLSPTVAIVLPSEKESKDNLNAIQTWYETNIDLAQMPYDTNEHHWNMMRKMTNQDLEALYEYAKINDGKWAIKFNLLDCVGQLLYKYGSTQGRNFIKAAELGLHAAMYNYCFRTSYRDTKMIEKFTKVLIDVDYCSWIRDSYQCLKTAIDERDVSKCEDIKAWCDRSIVRHQVSPYKGSVLYCDVQQLTPKHAEELYKYATDRLGFPIYANLAGYLAIELGKADRFDGRYFKMAGDAGSLLGMRNYLTRTPVSDRKVADGYRKKTDDANYR